MSVVESLDDQPGVADLAPINIFVYPNPFMITASIVFDTFVPERHVIEVYDSHERPVLQALKGEIQPGRHRIPLAAESLAEGVYFYRLSYDSFSRTTVSKSYTGLVPHDGCEQASVLKSRRNRQTAHVRILLK